MASTLANGAASMGRRASLLRLSLNFLRNFSASSATTNAATSTNPTASAAAKKPKHKKKKNLFEVAQFLPNWGIGYHMGKTHWTGVSYQITKINLYKDGRHGKAWGIVHKEGLPAADAPKKISGVHKRCWRYIPNSKKTEESTPKPEVEAA
uniref:28S ribosomal protein S34 n=1 Tax=Davidia involucrata TaxID=16924 RepID=A0A5B7ABW5_DAVIN